MLDVQAIVDRTSSSSLLLTASDLGYGSGSFHYDVLNVLEPNDSLGEKHAIILGKGVRA